MAALHGLPAAHAAGFDHSHAAWAAMLKKHVVPLEGGRRSQLRYAGMAMDRVALKAYLASLSAVPAAEFNTFTVELILPRYPKLASTKDLGNLLQSPCKAKFITLRDVPMSLDNIEHDTLRANGHYGEPRVHFAVNCASIGCPALREEAFTGERLDVRLEDQARRFMADRSRNRHNAQAGALEVSKVFAWFGSDFRAGHKGIASEATFFARYADQLADTPADRQAVRVQQARVTFTDCDWKLNDAR